MGCRLGDPKAVLSEVFLDNKNKSFPVQWLDDQV